jgi:hypothetical protein
MINDLTTNHSSRSTDDCDLHAKDKTKNIHIPSVEDGHVNLLLILVQFHKIFFAELY